MRVLVIDDDADLRELIQRALEKVGHVVTVAHNGNDGLEAFRSQTFDAVVTDIIMPKEDGIATLMAIRGVSKTVRIIAISGGGLRHDMNFLAAARRLGANATLGKPFDMQALVACLGEGGDPLAGDADGSAGQA